MPILRARRRAFVGWGLLVALGATVTGFWLTSADTGSVLRGRPALVGFALIGVCSLTTGNLLLRWLRWHYLTRSLDLQLKVRDSIGLYFATLPAILTPLYIGEIVRVVALARRYPRARQAVVWIWLIERPLDAAILGIFWLLASGRSSLAVAAGALLLGFVGVTRRYVRAGDRSAKAPYPVYAGVLIGSTLLSWSLPILALWGVVSLLGEATSPTASARAYSLGTPLGGLSRIPLGTGVTGSTAILALSGDGVPVSIATASVGLVRAGTAWFAVALGLVVLWLWKERLRQLVLGRELPYHFDVIATEYADQIPRHVREHLLARKISLMQRRLREAGITAGARGLDLGCGQGWYACEMAAAGYEMVGVDRSESQLSRARALAEERKIPVRFQPGRSSSLELDDASFDFAYAINVLHHVHDPAARHRLLDEVVRVLKKGGVFFLHEMNTRNPVFRFYLSYVFPLIREIDEGDERWIPPSAPPPVDGARWAEDVDYFNFLPDILPSGLLEVLAPIERWLESSRLCRLSAHYLARLTKY